jgi:hypothetical protein
MQHRMMSLATIVMNSAGVCVVALLALMVRDMPELAARSGPIYAGVLVLATLASERIRHHVVVEDRDSSPPCCEGAMKLSRLLLVLAWMVAIGLLVLAGISS